MNQNHACIEPLEARIAPATLTVTTLADAGPGSLRATLATAAEGDVVTFADSLHGILALDSTLEVEVGLTIKASTPGAITLSGKNAVQILTVNDGDDDLLSTVKLVNLNFIHGAASAAGGAILDAENLITSHCSFFGNHVTAGDGGAIAILGEGATVKLLSSKFTGNTATGEGGAVQFAGESGTLIATGSIFNSNTAARGGALAIEGVPTVEIKACQISGNTATQLGGGAYFSGVVKATFTATTVADNAVTGTASTTGGGGLALVDSTLRLLGTTLNGNVAGGSGGGLRIDATSNASIEASTLSANVAQWGGGLDFAGGVKLSGSKIAANLATQSGGGIYGEAGAQNLRIEGGSITGNQATGSTGGGLELLNGGTQILQHVKIVGNSASISGGGLAAANGNLNVSGTTFAKNGANIGGGVYLFAGTTTLTSHFAGCHFTGNSAVANGGGIYLAAAALSMKTSTLAGNNASQGGGALYVNAEGSAIVNGSTFQHNQASAGGALYFTGQVTLGTSAFLGNLAGDRGGAIFGDVGVQNFLIANSTISGNKAAGEQGSGGGFYLLGSGKQNIYTCQITGNQAVQGGGGISAANGVLNVIASTIAANRADFGGGVFLFAASVNASANFTDDVITNNKALTIGGGIYSATPNGQILSGTKVYGNHAPANGDLFGTFLQS